VTIQQITTRFEPNGDSLVTSLRSDGKGRSEVVVERHRGNGKPSYTVATVPYRRAREMGVI
jgi:hypothetical protein